MTQGLETGAEPLKYPTMGMFSVSQEIVISCICRGGNQRGVFYSSKYITLFFVFLFSSMTFRLRVVTQTEAV